MQKPAIFPPLPLSQTGTVFLPNDLQILCETSSRWKWSEARQRRPADKTSGPACSPTSIEYYQCPSECRRRRETASASWSANLCPHGRECTSRSSRADKTSLFAAQI